VSPTALSSTTSVISFSRFVPLGIG